jgi:hypothetical protein
MTGRLLRLDAERWGTYPRSYTSKAPAERELAGARHKEVVAPHAAAF